MRSVLVLLLLPALALARGPNRLRSHAGQVTRPRSHGPRDLDVSVAATVDAAAIDFAAEVDIDLNLTILGLNNETRAAQCSQPEMRPEWRTLSDAQKKEYLSAVRCLAATDAIQPSPYPGNNSGIKTLYDNFVATHIRHTDTVHFVGQFLPWHRYIVWSYEQALQQTCNYSGAQPYWDWTADDSSYGSVEAFTLSPIFDDVLGFGGNGTSTNDTSGYEPYLCVETGPFSSNAGWVVNMGPGNTIDYNPRCLVRAFNATRLDCGEQDRVDHLMNQTSYWDFSAVIDGRLDSAASNVHRTGHGGVGAEMENLYSSPSDPLFFLHHANIDRLWTQWQAADPATRTYDVSGNVVNKDWYGALYGNVTLDFEINWSELGGNRTLRELMSTTTGDFCYMYNASTTP